MNRLIRVAALSALVGAAGVSQAFIFFNSGINPGPPTSMIDYGQVDSKFTVRKISGLGADPYVSWSPFVVTPSPEEYTNAWIGDNTNIGWNSGEGQSFASRWLSPFHMANDRTRALGADLDQDVDGLYEFTYRFWVDAWEANWLNNNGGISGRWSSDNNSGAFWNGVQVSQLPGEFAFRRWEDFNLGNTNSGWNTLTFEVTNLAYDGFNPTGLRVEFQQIPAGAPIPEPFTMALGAGALALAAARKRAKQNKK